MKFLTTLLLLFSLGASLSLRAQETEPAVGELLDPAKQKTIWDAEHITFKMEKRFGQRFLTALKAHDNAALTALLHDDCTGNSIAPDSPINARTAGFVSQSTRRTSESHSLPTQRSDLAAAITAPFSEIQTFTNASLRILKIKALPPAGTLEQWQTEVLLTATGTAADHSLRAVDSKHQVVFRIPTDTDFADGPAILSWNIQSEKQRQADRPLMEEVSAQTGLKQLPLVDNWNLPPNDTARQFRKQIAVEDFDGDGFLDIALATLDGATVLLKSIQGRGFTVANRGLGLPLAANQPLRAIATWIDFNNDGHPDLILGDRIYKNLNGARFEEITKTCGLTFRQSPKGCVVADYDGDGFLDLYVLYQSAGEATDAPVPWVGDDTSGATNVLWRNRGDNSFEDVTVKANATGGTRNSFAASWLYADDDLLPDLYIANDFGTNNLLRNRGDGTFEDIAQASGVADFATSMGVCSGDLSLPEKGSSLARPTKASTTASAPAAF